MSEVAERKMSKIKAVQACIEAGEASDNLAGIAWIAKTYGLAITPPMFSSYKSKLTNPAKPAGVKKERKKKATAFVKPHYEKFSAVNGNGHGSLTDHASLAIAMHNAVQKYGADVVKTVLELATKS
jgi:hypothetical protein